MKKEIAPIEPDPTKSFTPEEWGQILKNGSELLIEFNRRLNNPVYDYWSRQSVYVSTLRYSYSLYEELTKPYIWEQRIQSEIAELQNKQVEPSRTKELFNEIALKARELADAQAWIEAIPQPAVISFNQTSALLMRSLTTTRLALESDMDRSAGHGLKRKQPQKTFYHPIDSNQPGDSRIILSPRQKAAATAGIIIPITAISSNIVSAHEQSLPQPELPSSQDEFLSHFRNQLLNLSPAIPNPTSQSPIHNKHDLTSPQNPDRQDPRQEGERGDFSFRASIISGGNIRTEAGLNKDVIDSLSNYTTNGILVTGIDTEGDAFGNSTEWYQVVLSDGRLAYVHSSLINVSVEQRQQLITEQAVFIADMLTNTESETPFSGQPPSDSTPLQEGSGNIYPWGKLVDAGEITSGGAEVLDQTAQTLKSSIESIVASQGKTAVTSVSWNGQLGDEFRIAVVAFRETSDTRTIYWPLTDSGNLSFSPTVWNQNGDHIELTFPKPIELSIGFNDGHENPYLIISHQDRPFAFLDTRTEHQKVLPLPGSEVPPELVQAILDGLEDPQVLDRFAPPLTEQQLAEQAEVLKMYPYGDEQALFQFAEQEGLSLLWNPELLAYEARENDKTYYFFPKMGMDGAKFTPRRYEADLRDGLTHFGGSLESQDYEKGVSGIKLNIFTSRNFEVDSVPLKLVFQEDLSNNQDKVDAFLRLLLEKILQPGRQINIILASDHFPVNGSSPEAIKSALELSGNYTFAVVSNDARTGSNLINEHTNLVRVSIDSSLSRYEDPDYLGEFVFVMVISHFLSNGRLDANDFNTTARGSREMLRLYEELGLHGFVLRAVPVTD